MSSAAAPQQVSLARLRSHKWLAFVIQQVLLFAGNVLFWQSLIRLTGLNRGAYFSGAVSPAPLIIPGLLITILAIGLSIGVYRWTEGPGAPPLGLRPTRARLLQFGLGLLIAYGLWILPTCIAALTGAVRVTETAAAHFSIARIALHLAIVAALFIPSAFAEEATSRAVPLTLLRHWPLVARLLVPTLAFAGLHLAGQPFDLGTFMQLVLGGLAFGVLYLLTGNVWLVAGVHAGTNLAGSAFSGRWQMGAIAAKEGTVVTDVVVDAVWIAVVVVGLWRLRRRRSTPAVALRVPDVDGATP